MTNMDLSNVDLDPTYCLGIDETQCTAKREMEVKYNWDPMDILETD